MSAGVFITLEGPEGGGKSTQVRRLAARLAAAGHEVVCTREPGGTPTGEAIRGLLQHDAGGEPLGDEAEVFLFAASRAQLVRTVIRPALARGAIVISDRFVDSTLAYQGHGRGFPMETIETISEFAVAGTWPDLTVLLDLEVEAGFARVRGRHAAGAGAEDRIEREARAFHERVRAGFLDLARRWPGRIRTVDATAPEDLVAEQVGRLVDDVVARKRGPVA
jgi:dTMP kinase